MEGTMNIFNIVAKIFGYKSTDKVEIQSVNTPGMYLLNDPTTPTLSEPQVLPATPVNLQFRVDGYVSVGLGSHDAKISQAVNCYITLCKSINHFQGVIGKIDKPVPRWAATSNLHVVPQAGRDFNAYYDRSSLKFFYDLDPVTRKTVYAADSIDVVAHELGHALLDIMRPDLWNTQALEIFAFHEAFGDINAMATVMRSDTILSHVLTETGGDLMKSNTLSRLAEELGNAIYHIAPEGRVYGYLRDATVVFNYVNPNKLPQQANDNQLCAEPHSFGRIFAGCWYEIVAKIFAANRVKMGDLPAFRFARDTAYSCLIKAIKIAPNVVKFTEAMAKSMVAADKMKGTGYADLITDVFTRRHVIRPAIKMMSETTWNDEINKLTKLDQVTKKGDIISVRKIKNKPFKISDHIVIDLAASNNPLYDVEMEVPSEHYYLFDKGVLVDEISTDKDEMLQSAIVCALAVYNYHGVGPDKMWRIENNKLIRNHIVCKCGK